MNNRVAYLTEKSKVEIHKAPIPKPKADEVLIRVKHCGICGSDVHNYREGRTGKRIISYPFVLGHEFAGEIVDWGEDVCGWKKGDLVCVEPGVPCGVCGFCKSGRYNLCGRMKFMSAYPNEGCMKDYVVFPARNCFRLPENFTTVEGALMEPLAVGLHAANRGEVKTGDTAVILGMGCIGLMTLLACKARNGNPVIAVDIFENRLQRALELGAQASINSSKEDMVSRIEQLTGGELADVVFETAGRPETMQKAVELVKPGGTIVTVGNISEPTLYRFVDINMKEVTIKGVFRYQNVFPLALRLVSEGIIDVSAIGPTILPFEQVGEAFVCASEHGREVIKCILEM